MEKPDVEHIEGLSPAISIEQKSTSHNPRSTVGTITEIHDYLRLLFARAGEPRCPDHGVALEAQTVTEMVDTVMARTPGERLMLLAPIVGERKGEHARIIEGLRSQGFVRARIDGALYELDEPPALDPKRKHSIEVVVDRFRVREDLALRLAESFETALALSDGRAVIAPMDGASHDGRASLNVGRRPTTRPAATTAPAIRDGTSAATPCSPPASPATSAATRSRSWSRGSSPSTAPPAPASSATGSGCARSSTPPGSSPIPSRAFPPGRSAAGIGATPTTSR